MFSVGDNVVYESLGVCRVKDIVRKTFEPLPERDYYVLEMVYGPATTVYAPVDSDKLNIRPVLGASEVGEIIASMPSRPEISGTDDGERRSRFREIITSGDRDGLVRIIKTLYSRRENVPKGRKFPDADERLMRDAERILYEEFALVLGIKPTEVIGYIYEHIDQDGKES